MGCCLRNSLDTNKNEDKNNEIIYYNGKIVSSGSNIVININNNNENNIGSVNVNNSEISKNSLNQPTLPVKNKETEGEVNNTEVAIKSIKQSKSTTYDETPVKNRRSSLRHDNLIGLGSDKVNKLKAKRNSVSFNPQNLQYKSMKAMFDVDDSSKKMTEKEAKEAEEKKKKFEESRRKSIHNEFAKVKEMMKNKIEEEEDEEDVSDECKKNMMRNMEEMKKVSVDESESESSKN